MLLPPSVLPLLVNASQVAPPVAVSPEIAQKLTETVPLALDNTAAVAPDRVIVSTLPDCPDAVKLLSVVVDPDWNEIAVAPVAAYVLVMLVNVLLPEIVSEPEPPWLSVG